LFIFTTLVSRFHRRIAGIGILLLLLAPLAFAQPPPPGVAGLLRKVRIYYSPGPAYCSVVEEYLHFYELQVMPLALH
jgi:hypothetical protein